MLLSLQQAADRLGKSVRQVRYMIQTGALPARKDGGRWRVAADDLPLSSGQRAAVERRERALQSAVEDGLGIEQPSRKRWSVRDLKAFQIGLPLYHQASAERPADDPAVLALRRMLLLLGRGCHRFDRDEKAAAYREARDAASQAAASGTGPGTCGPRTGTGTSPRTGTRTSGSASSWPRAANMPPRNEGRLAERQRDGAMQDPAGGVLSPLSTAGPFQ